MRDALRDVHGVARAEGFMLRKIGTGVSIALNYTSNGEFPDAGADSKRDVTVSERKTGLKVRDVATVRLVRDERGWLRLAG